MISRRFPLIFIVGATGTGKSQLAIELALKFKGEIISADSMQVYKGLDIITNKVTRAERDAVPHHLIDYVSPLTTEYNVVDFRKKALPVIDRLIEDNKAAIVVGGTNYYIEAVLWDLLIPGQAEGQPDKSSESHVDVAEEVTQDASRTADSEPESHLDRFKDVPSHVLHQQLSQVDPVMAQRLHPNNKRKIIRALEVYDDHGVTMSEILSAQHSQLQAGDISGPLRYPHSVVLWMTSNQQVLDSRLDKRVKTMLDQGLLQELTDFHQKYNEKHLQKSEESAYTEGIFQSIGFKEFHDYLILSNAEKETADGQKLLSKGIEDMKTATRRYARYQKKWIVNRFLKRRGQNVPAVYSMDSSSPENWKEDVLEPASDIITSVLKGEVPTQKPLPTEENSNEPQYNVCDVCELVFVNTSEWQAHLKGRRHKRAVERQYRRDRITEQAQCVLKDTEQAEPP